MTYMTAESWYTPIIYSKYVCKDNNNHMFFSDIYEDTVLCPNCECIMECVNWQELQNLGLNTGDQIPSSTQPPSDYVE
jgi:hypothetical protein